jgi:(S)-ureidoglycine-glyoxylate aminotransferase
VSVGLQKCLGSPSGSAPITLSENAVAAIRKRRHIEAGIRTEHHIAAAIERHRVHGNAMAQGLAAMNLKLFGNQRHKMHNVVGVYIPEGVAGEAVRSSMLNDFGIEIGASFGPLHGKIWRIGTMGYSARKDAVV